MANINTTDWHIAVSRIRAAIQEKETIWSRVPVFGDELSKAKDRGMGEGATGILQLVEELIEDMEAEYATTGKIEPAEGL